MKRGLVILLYNFGKRFMGWTLHMIMCVLCYPVSIRMSQLQSTGRPISSFCSNQEKALHINVLELKAMFLALKSLQNKILNQRILIATDNATVVSYLNKQVATHSWDMCLLVWHILAYCSPRNILIRADIFRVASMS